MGKKKLKVIELEPNADGSWTLPSGEILRAEESADDPVSVVTFLQEIQEQAHVAAGMSHDAIRHGIREALLAGTAKKVSGEYEIYPYVVDVYPSFFIYEEGDNQYYRRDYSTMDGKVTLGESKVAVERAWMDVTKENYSEAQRLSEAEEEDGSQPPVSLPQKTEPQRVAEAMEPGVKPLRESLVAPFDSLVLEAAEDGAPVLKGVTIIKEGKSVNRRSYSSDVLQRDGPSCFEGAPAYVTNHVRAEKNVRNLVGIYENVRYENGALKADLRGLASDPTPLQKAVEAASLLGPERVGISIDTGARMSVRNDPSGLVQEVTALVRSRQTSGDIVIDPSAGGRLTECVEELAEMDKIKLLTEAVLNGMDQAAVQFITEGITDDDIRTANPSLADKIIAKRLGTQTTQPATQRATEQQPAAMSAQQIQEMINQRVRVSECRSLLANTIAREQAAIGPIGVELLNARFGGEDRVFEQSELDAELTRLRDMAGKSRPNIPYVPGQGNNVQVTEARDVNVARLLAAVERRPYFELNGRTYNAFTRISEAILAFHPEMMPLWVNHPQDAATECLQYFQWNGGSLSRAVEALEPTDLNAAWADVLNRTLLRTVRDPELNSWRQIVSQTVNFRDLTTTHKLVRVGELSTDVPVVLPGGTYQPIGNPPDEQETLSIDKRGYLYQLTWEALLRDDIGALARIPRDLGRAFSWTVHDQVWGMLQLNAGAGPTMDADSKSLYHADHGNINLLAFNATNLETARQKFVTQTDIGSGRRKMYRGRYLAYTTPSLDQVIWESLMSQFKITASASEINLPNFIRSFMGLEPIPVIYPTATTTRWEMIADPQDADTIAVGFLGGRDVPDIFIQDQETVGSRFTADVITYKLRFTFGVTALDYRSFVRGNA